MSDQMTERCADCGAQAVRLTADGVPLCEGDYQHLLEHWILEGFSHVE